MRSIRTVLIIGLDGLDPKIVESLLEAGSLPHLKALAQSGGYSRIATTYAAQTPVPWSTFATGTNPGGDGIFDFIRRDASTYLPEVALNRYVQKSAFLPPRPWELLSGAGIPRHGSGVARVGWARHTSIHAGTISRNRADTTPPPELGDVRGGRRNGQAAPQRPGVHPLRPMIAKYAD